MALRQIIVWRYWGIIFRRCPTSFSHAPRHPCRSSRGWRTARDATENEYEPIACPACTRLHFLNRKTGKLVGQDDDDSECHDLALAVSKQAPIKWGSRGDIERAARRRQRVVPEPFEPLDLFPYIYEPLPTAAEVTSMAPSPSGTPNRTGIGIPRRCRIHARCRIDRILINHHWRPYNYRSANDDGTRFLDNDGRSRSVLVRLSFPLIAWNLAIGSYRQIGGRCWRGKS